MIERVLAIETSCDDTSVAVVRADGTVEQLISANQDLAHAPFGGVVPEIASRNHTLHLLPLIEKLQTQCAVQGQVIDAYAVTNRPGLVGSLIVGLMTAKTLAQVQDKPWIAVNHLEGHILAPFLRDDSWAPPSDWAPPFLALAVSGGHSSIYKVTAWGEYEILGTTLDDAAGEVFDKFGKMLGLPFPGGAQVDRLAEHGNPQAFHLPRGLALEENLQMSFSGVKASAQRLLESLPATEVQARQADLCASFREAVVEALLIKLDRAVRTTGLRRVVITGGVSANIRLREWGQQMAATQGWQLLVPPLRYCTDNAAMIGLAGIYRLRRGERSALEVGPSPNSWPGDFSQAADFGRRIR